MNQPVALMTPEDVRRYRFLIENLCGLDTQREPSGRWIVGHWQPVDDPVIGHGETPEDAIDDLMRQLKWEPKS